MAKTEKAEPQTLEQIRAAALDLAIASVEATYGAGCVTSFDNTEPLPGVEFIPSGCFSLDRALGGGYAKGRIIEILGPESSGKTTLSLLAVANAQKTDPRMTLYIDMEHALDMNYAKALGVDTKRMLLTQPDSAEEALNSMLTFIKSGAISIAVIDSVAALTPQAEIEKNIGDSSMGRQALLMSQAMRLIVGPAGTNNTTIIFINQIRMKIGIVYGNPETTSGGNALKFYASQRLDIRAGEKQEDGEDVTGRMTKVKVIKNKVFPPFREAVFPIEFGTGIDPFKDLVTVAIAAGILEKAGAWIKWNGELVGQGFNKTANHFRENPEATERLKAALQSKK